MSDHWLTKSEQEDARQLAESFFRDGVQPGRMILSSVVKMAIGIIFLAIVDADEEDLDEALETFCENMRRSRPVH